MCEYSISTLEQKSFIFIMEVISAMCEIKRKSNLRILGMANHVLVEEQREDIRLIIEELLEDGSDPYALYTIEHHLFAKKFEALERCCCRRLQAGF